MNPTEELVPYDEALAQKNNVTEGERLLTQIGDKIGMDENAQAAVIAMTDPFHDSILNCNGFPDGYSLPSVVQVITQQFTITVNSAFAGANWDCHFCLFPWLGPATDPANPTNPTLVQGGLVGTTIINGNLTDQFGTINNHVAFPFGCSVFQNASSNNNVQFFQAANGAMTHGIGIPTTYTDTDFRIIGAAFEVCNTTNALNVSGNVTCYRAPAPGTKSFTLCKQKSNTSTHDEWDINQGVILRAPPGSSSDAENLPGTDMWRASEGNYSVQTFHINDLVEVSNSFTQPYVYLNTSTDPFVFTTTNVSAGNSVQVGFGSTNVGAFQTGVYQAMNFSDADYTGAIYTGLDPKTSLVLRVRYIMQIWPGARDRLNVLSKSVPEYSEMALRMITEINRKKLAGARYCDNFLGTEFLDSILGVLDTALPIAAAVGVPGAGALALGNKALKGFVPKKGSQQEKLSAVLNEVDKVKKKTKKSKKQKAPAPKKPAKAKKQKKRLSQLEKDVAAVTFHE